MRSHLRILGTGVAIIAALTMPACSKNKTKSQKVLISVHPSDPNVFTTDYDYHTPGGTTVSVKAPWFQITEVSIENQSDSSVLITSLHVEVTGQDANGNFVTVPADIQPSSNNFQSTTLSCDYSYFGLFTKSGTTGSKGNLGMVKSSSSSSGCPTGVVSFVLGNNPTPASTDSIRYTVKVKPMGFFVDGNGTPTDRFVNFMTIYTR